MQGVVCGVEFPPSTAPDFSFLPKEAGSGLRV